MLLKYLPHVRCSFIAQYGPSAPSKPTTVLHSTEPKHQKRRGALLDFVLTDEEKLLESLKAKGSLGCTDHEMLLSKTTIKSCTSNGRLGKTLSLYQPMSFAFFPHSLPNATVVGVSEQPCAVFSCLSD